MTREEAENLCENCSLDVDGYYWKDVEDLIMKLSDDFESRSCGNCEHFMKAPNEWLENECLNTLNEEIINFGIGSGFGCNRWEEKEA